MPSPEERRLNLAHQNLKTVPKTLVNSYHSIVNILDISNNNINDVSFLASFHQLSSIIVDHNELTSDVVFPHLPTVRILWANHNQIRRMGVFIRNLAASFPNLRQLSLMGNPGSPLCHEDSYYEYLRYRLYVISCFEGLEYLDDRPVTDHEREEAQRIFGNSYLLNKLLSFGGAFSGAMTKVRQYISTSDSNRATNILI